jgi:hypothetical protein
MSQPSRFGYFFVIEYETKKPHERGKDGTIRRSGTADERKPGRDAGPEEAMGVYTA